MNLAGALLASAPSVAERLAQAHDLEALVQGIVSTARQAWPAFPVPAEEFLSYLGQRLSPDGDPVEALRTVYAIDLYLACACARGQAWAVAVFERDYLSQVGLIVASMTPTAQFIDEVKQDLRTRLLVAEAHAPARIAGYSGQGPLAGWLRVSAMRVAIDLRRSSRKETARDVEAPADLVSSVADPEIQYLKQRYQSDLEAALKQALAAVSPREATLLRLHLLDGLPGPAIAVMYRVSPRTARRWIADAREKVLKETRRLLGERLAVSTSELDTLLGLVQSQISISLQDLKT